jgi:hypothetical protein
MKALDKVLSMFGLMTIEKARHIHNESFKLYARATAKFAQDDFGIPPSTTLEKDAVRWSNECFDQLIKEYGPDIVYIGAWELHETVVA